MSNTEKVSPSSTEESKPEIEEIQERRLLPNFGGLKLIYIVYAFFGVLLAGTAAFMIFQPVQVLPRERLSPGFIFTNQDGETLNSEYFRGKLTLYNFTYTRCQPPSCGTAILMPIWMTDHRT